MTSNQPLAKEITFWNQFLQRNPHVASVYVKIPGIAGIEINLTEDVKHSNSNGRKGK